MYPKIWCDGTIGYKMEEKNKKNFPQAEGTMVQNVSMLCLWGTSLELVCINARRLLRNQRL